jgi:hypothetical protein
MPCFNGQNAEVSTDQTCLDTGVDFTDLLGMGIKLLETDEMMQKSPGMKQARY